jgi:hypothetical protein
MPIETSRDEGLQKQLGFNGGLNLRDAPDEITPIEVSQILNMVYNERGAVSSRNGCTTEGSVGSSGDRILSMYRFDQHDAGPQLIVHTSAGHVKYSGDLVNYTDIWTGMSTTEPFSYEIFNGKIYMTNGVDDYRWWDGVTPGTVPTAPKGKFIRLWQDTMYVAGVPGELTKLYQSAAGDAETYPISNFTHLHKDDGDPITGLGNDGYFLVVFKRGRGFIIYNAANLFSRLIDYEKGCESHFSIINHENSLYYLSKFGIVLWNNQSPGQIVSDRLDPLFQSNILNFSVLDKSYAYRTEHRVGWALPETGQSTPSFQVEFYPHLPEAPSTIHRIPAQAFALWRSGTVEHLLGAKTTGNKVLRLFNGPTDDGEAFPSFFRTGWTDWDWPNSRKYLRYLRILAKGKFSINFLRDYQDAIIKTRQVSLESDVDLWDVNEAFDINATWGGGSTRPQWTDLQPDVYGRQFAMEFHGTVSGVDVREVDIGGVSYLLDMGQWGVNEVVIHGLKMGDRLP